MKTTLEELLAFVTVVDSNSITHAASKLNQTVSGISRALGRLEEKLETSLLNRTTRRLALTEEGQAFLVHARKILAAVDEAEDQIAIRRQQPSGLLRVNAASPFMIHTIVPIIGEFRRLYPQIELELNTNDHFIDLLEHKTDIAIRIGELRDSTLHARHLGSSQRRALASPEYLKNHPTITCTDDLTSHQLLGFTQIDKLNEWPFSDDNGHLLHITPNLTASSGETLRQLALAGEGIVCLSDFMTHKDRMQGDLIEILPQQTVKVMQPINAVYYRNTQLSARITCFLDFLSHRIKIML
ncbi:LysR family transcriptional regulator [Limnobaculum zhutongyuii]|uniref:LysR family transcriptional regulator n=1 Tax=Limnobaculum zhutongyuii TaxID=2498113 RepID=A0A411WQJ5_9GAMM|nr:LysR family transcriptional regulator [Limnobaculum zhutongyuii]QBH98533.1 LysR family transcriptional regulator [Limnobaculum zhutongyuii]TQS86465.1 LysR family transcriptional regulator [Limnobaculum zhutongyuii]